MPNETILDDLESDLTVEITLYDDAEIEITLNDTKHERCGLTFCCNVNDFEKGLKKARAKLDI